MAELFILVVRSERQHRLRWYSCMVSSLKDYLGFDLQELEVGTFLELPVLLNPLIHGCPIEYSILYQPFVSWRCLILDSTVKGKMYHHCHIQW